MRHRGLDTVAVTGINLLPRYLNGAPWDSLGSRLFVHISGLCSQTTVRYRRCQRGDETSHRRTRIKAHPSDCRSKSDPSPSRSPAALKQLKQISHRPVRATERDEEGAIFQVTLQHMANKKTGYYI